MKNKNLIITILVVIVVVGISFYAGMQYQMRQNSREEKGQMIIGNARDGQVRSKGQGNFRFGSKNANGMMPVSGEIISTDANSMTVKLPDGSSKIVILSSNTKIYKTSDATKTDLQPGEAITTFGAQNSDGSITAQNVSLGNGAMMFRSRTGGGSGQAGQQVQPKQ